jgi:carboxypeptidase family protein
MRTRVWAVAPWIGLCLMVGLLAGCGGSSSSSTGPSSRVGGGGSSGAVVQGQLVNRRSASGESTISVVFRTALGIGLAEAAPVGNVTVTLTRQDGATLTTQADADGNFVFTNVLPGTYTISVEDPITHEILPVDPPDSITVGAGDVANITGTVTESEVTVGNVTVVAAVTDSNIILQNDAQVAHLLNIANAAGLPSADPVLQLRLAGWGWGRIARHFSVHPGVIGLGHTGVSDADIETFRASHGHGNGKGKGKKKGQA